MFMLKGSTILEKAENKLCGDTAKLDRTFSDAFGPDLEGRVDRYRSRLKKKYQIIMCITALLLVVYLIASMAGNRGVNEFRRPEPGDEDIIIPLQVSAEYHGVKSQTVMDIQLKNRSLTDKEKEEKLDECEVYLKSLFKSDESGRLIADRSIHLPDSYSRGQVDIEWSSSDPVLIDEEGNVDVIALAGEKETVILSADISCDTFYRLVELEIVVADDPNMYSDAVNSRLGEFISHINDNPEAQVVELPAELAGEIELLWSRRSRKWGILVVFIGGALFLMVYAGRYRKAIIMAREYRQKVTEAFPSVIDKLILLLNSGLTVFSALMRISEDHERNIKISVTPLGTEAAGIGIRVRNTNADIVDEWRQLAVRMESGDMLRFCSLLSENMSTGSGLAEKLEAESENLREMRRKDIRKKIQLVDSRMIVPMMVMLFSLILITVAPAMLSFG